MVHDANASHIGGALSMADILAVLYTDILKYDPQNPAWDGRDRFILSKGHACVSLYAALALKGKSVSIYAKDVELPEGEYFDVELEGCTVVDDATGAELGTLKRVLHYPAHKVYEVKGEREYLIPAVPGVFIASVDIDAGVVRVHMMKGLATDEN